MKKFILAAVMGLLARTVALAVPVLQFDASPSLYTSTLESAVTMGNMGTLYAVLNNLGAVGFGIVAIVLASRRQSQLIAVRERSIRRR